MAQQYTPNNNSGTRECPPDTVNLWGQDYSIENTTSIYMVQEEALNGATIPDEIGCLVNLTSI